MAEHEIATGNDRKFNWDDDDDDDFDLDTWKATVDTSSPSVDELGPLQLSRCGESIEATSSYVPEHDTDGDAYMEPLASHVTNMALDQSLEIDLGDGHTPELEAVEASSEAVCSNIINTTTEEEIASARHEYLTHAIGIYYDGKDEADVPAYPELSPYNDQRYRYAKAFQNVSQLTGRQRAQVYRHSPLVFVTGIEEAHLIGNRRRYENVSREKATEVKNMDLYEPPELQEPQPDFNIVYGEEEQENANEQVAPRRTPAQEHFSRDELKELIGMWKAQQERDGAEEPEEEEEEEDSSSIDTWEKSDEDEEETFEPLETEFDDDENMFSIVRPLEPRASTHNEELDFNDVVFCAEPEYETGGRDEGYMSSSPPISPVIGTCIDGCGWQAQHIEAPVRPKRAVRVDSMDALDTLATVEEYGASSDDSCDEEEETPEMVERKHYETKIGNRNDIILKTLNHDEPTKTTPSFSMKVDSGSTSAVEAAVWKELSKDCSVSHLTVTPSTYPEQTKQQQQQQQQTLPAAYVSSVLTTSFLYISMLTAGTVIRGSIGAATPRDTRAPKMH